MQETSEKQKQLASFFTYGIFIDMIVAAIHFSIAKEKYDFAETIYDSLSKMLETLDPEETKEFEEIVEKIIKTKGSLIAQGLASKHTDAEIKALMNQLRK